MSDICNVKNRSGSHVVYTIPEIGVRRSFAPGEVKKITFSFPVLIILITL